jgi:hypothetical protein
MPQRMLELLRSIQYQNVLTDVNLSNFTDLLCSEEPCFKFSPSRDNGVVIIA